MPIERAPDQDEWLLDENEARKVYIADDGTRRVEWTSQSHRLIAEQVPLLRQVVDTARNFTIGELSNIVRLLARHALLSIKVALHDRTVDPAEDVEQGTQ